MKQIDWIPPHHDKTRWYQRQYRGPYWLWAVIVVALWATVVSLVEDLADDSQARVTVEELS